MDEIVKQAMAKWPNVPHCYGWLALDARGGWRMRDERAQALQLPGDRITNAALLGFINRNYTHDEKGRWYFQNGPQRVYVNLDATPYIARTDPAHGFLLHTGDTFASPEAAWLTETGQLILEGAGKVAMLDDRDLAQVIPNLRIGGLPLGDAQLLDWLSEEQNEKAMTLDHHGQSLPVRRISAKAIAEHFGFVRVPQADKA